MSLPTFDTLASIGLPLLAGVVTFSVYMSQRNKQRKHWSEKFSVTPSFAPSLGSDSDDYIVLPNVQSHVLPPSLPREFPAYHHLCTRFSKTHETDGRNLKAFYSETESALILAYAYANSSQVEEVDRHTGIRKQDIITLRYGMTAPITGSVSMYFHTPLVSGTTPSLNDYFIPHELPKWEDVSSL